MTNKLTPAAPPSLSSIIKKHPIQMKSIYELITRHVGPTEAPEEGIVEAQIELTEPVVQLYGLTKTERSESPGAVVRGVVFFLAKDSEWKISLLKINVQGTFEKSDITIRGKKLIPYDTTFLDESIYLFKNCAHQLPTGVLLQFPFQYFLNADMPETVTTIYGSIRYELKLLMEVESRSSIELYLKSIERPLGSVELKVLRELGPLCCWSSDPIIVQGIWRNILNYKLSCCDKIVKINSHIACSVKLSPLVSESYKVHMVKVFLQQEISINANKIKQDCLLLGITRYKFTQKGLLREHVCTVDDFDENGDLLIDWDLPLTEQYTSKGPCFKIYPYTSQSELDPNTPNLKISHRLKIAVILEQFTKKTDPSQKSSSSLFCVLTGMNNENDSSTRQKIDLSLSAPIYLIHKDSAPELPPCYDIASPLLTTTSQISQPCNSPTVVPISMRRNSSLQDAQFRPFEKTVASESTASVSILSGSTWFDIVERWTSETPPSYAE